MLLFLYINWAVELPVLFFKFLIAYWVQRAGAVFPQRVERSAPVFTPSQMQPLTSYPQHVRTPEHREEGAESSAEAEFPSLRYIRSPFSLFYIWLNHQLTSNISGANCPHTTGPNTQFSLELLSD